MIRIFLVLLLALLSSQSPLLAQERFITLASTTSTEQSGLFAHILPLFSAESGIAVRVVAVGTGQALQIGARGDADALLVHDREGEDRFVAQGHGVDRHDVMYNDYVVIGPAADPAFVRVASDARDGFSRIAAAGVPFVSRGDDSGTHRAERKLWRDAGIELAATASWYREVGQGMGPTLNVAAGIGAYVFADRATWASFKNRQGLTILLEGDPALLNPYASILVNPAKGSHIKAADARRWHEWLKGPAGRAAIASFRVAGEQVFFPTGTTSPRDR